MDKPICPLTGKTMERGFRPLTLTYKDETVTISMPGWYCASSEEGIHTGKDLKVSDRALNELKARVEGLLTPMEIRQVRKKLKLTQAQAGSVIGGGPRAFQKYESGELLPSRAICSALRLLDEHPQGLELLSEKVMTSRR